MEENIFNQNNLRLCDWQYTIRHTDTKQFVSGEKVFLKSNPEKIMTVYSIREDVVVTSCNRYNEIQLYEFPPECILQYRYAGLKTYKNKIHVSLN